MEEKEYEKRMCGMKRAYYKRSKAKSIMNKMKREGFNNLNIYSCSYCDWFHIGHKNDKKNNI